MDSFRQDARRPKRGAPEGFLAGLAVWLVVATPSAAQKPEAPAEVVVTAQKPVTQVLLDRKVYRTSNDLQSTTGTAADILNNVPSVSVDADGNVALRGDTNVTILVDGKPSAQFNNASRGTSILSLPAGSIDHVEVMTTPPAQYKAEGAAGIINIVTKRSNKTGVSGSARFTLGNQRRGAGGVDIDGNFGGLKLHGGLSYRQDYKVRDVADSRIATDPTTNKPVASTQKIDEHFLRHVPSIDLSAEDQLNGKQTIGVTFNHREQTGKRFFDQDDTNGPAPATIANQSLRHSDGHEWSMDGSEGLTFDQKLRTPDETLKFALTRSATRERERYFYTNSFFVPPSPTTNDTLHLSHDLIKTELAIDYAIKTAGGIDLKAGYDLEDNRNAFDETGDLEAPVGSPLVPNPGLANHFRYHQQIDALYGDVRAPFGLWVLDTGLRVEDAHASTFQEIGAVSGRSSDFGVYPSLHLERAIDPAQTIFLSLARRVTRPDPEALNPFIDTQNSRNLRQGNPGLRPQDTWIYEAAYAFAKDGRSYGATLYYRSDRNTVTDILRPLANGALLATKTNLPLSRSGGAEFNAAGRLGAALAYSVSGDAFYAQIDASALGFTGLRSTFGVNLKANLDYRLTTSDLIQLSYSRADARLTPQGGIAAINLLNLGYRHAFSDRLALVGTLSDALDGQRFIRSANTPTLTDRYERHQLGQVVFVGFTYSFGGAAKAKKPTFDYDK